MRRERRAGSSPQSSTRARRNVRPLVARAQRAARARGRRGGAGLPRRRCVRRFTRRTGRHAASRPVSTASMAATSPAGGAAPRLRSVDSSSGDMEMAGVPRAELKEHKDSHQTRSRAVGSLAHVAATALKRKNAVVRVAVASIVAFFAAAGIAKVTRRFLFHSDVVGHCDALPSTARVAVLLAGSPRAFNPHALFVRATRRETAARSRPPGGRLLFLHRAARGRALRRRDGTRGAAEAAERPRRGIHDHRRRRHSTSAGNVRGGAAGTIRREKIRRRKDS